MYEQLYVTLLVVFELLSTQTGMIKAMGQLITQLKDIAKFILTDQTKCFHDIKLFIVLSSGNQQNRFKEQDFLQFFFFFPKQCHPLLLQSDFSQKSFGRGDIWKLQLCFVTYIKMVWDLNSCISHYCISYFFVVVITGFSFICLFFPNT